MAVVRKGLLASLHKCATHDLSRKNSTYASLLLIADLSLMECTCESLNECLPRKKPPRLPPSAGDNGAPEDTFVFIP